MRYAWIKAQEGSCSVKALCQVLAVRCSGYYAWQRPRSSDGKAEGWRVGRPRVAKRMQRLGLSARAARQYQATTQSKHPLPVAPHRLEQDFTASAPNQQWVSDLTYLWTSEGWLLPSGGVGRVFPCGGGLVHGGADYPRLGDPGSHHGPLAASAPSGLDRSVRPGQPVCANDYQRWLERHGLLCSRSRKGDGYDNAAMESFFHSLKVEQTEGTRYATRKEAKADMFEYIESYYNRQRRHSTLNYLSPCDFEARMAA